ncbi:hypothetical protein BRL54_08580 [Corynebacterium ulcerans]|nr:Hypothetical protein Cul210932_1735 [Corynebacterium ulcerans]ALD95454.1 Hypothetical protein Cul131001_1763 [Corynebacterium ulcerans]PLW02028.1 hypothetical protein BRL54_08580 [Corynebacterium ulcerans]
MFLPTDKLIYATLSLLRTLKIASWGFVGCAHASVLKNDKQARGRGWNSAKGRRTLRSFPTGVKLNFKKSQQIPIYSK